MCNYINFVLLILWGTVHWYGQIFFYREVCFIWRHFQMFPCTHVYTSPVNQRLGWRKSPIFAGWALGPVSSRERFYRGKSRWWTRWRRRRGQTPTRVSLWTPCDSLIWDLIINTQSNSVCARQSCMIDNTTKLNEIWNRKHFSCMYIIGCVDASYPCICNSVPRNKVALWPGNCTLSKWDSVTFSWVRDFMPLLWTCSVGRGVCKRLPLTNGENHPYVCGSFFFQGNIFRHAWHYLYFFWTSHKHKLWRVYAVKKF